MNLKPADAPIPEEWRDPRRVMPHLADELAGWLVAMRSIEADLTVLEGALDLSDGELHQMRANRPAELLEHVRVMDCIASIHGRLVELNHQVAGRAQAFRLIGEALNHG